MEYVSTRIEELEKGLKYNIDSINAHLDIITVAAQAILVKANDPEVCENAIKIISSANISRKHLGTGLASAGDGDDGRE